MIIWSTSELQRKIWKRSISAALFPTIRMFRCHRRRCGCPTENAWVPIKADGYMYIDCLWVSGSFKGHGYSTDLLNACIDDSKEKGRKGLCILAASKKKPFLADPKFLKYKGFTVCDEADNGIQLWYLPFVTDADKPHFRECAKHPHIEEKGYVLYYTSQCPFNAKYVPVLEQTAKDRRRSQIMRCSMTGNILRMSR